MTTAFTHSSPPKVEVKGVLSAALPAAEGLVLRVETGEPGNIPLLSMAGTKVGTVTGGPRHFTVVQDGQSLHIDLDDERRAIAFQGGWWYRGEYHVVEHPEGTLLTLQVYNVAAATSRWAVPLANRFFIGFAEQTRESFTRTLQILAQRLDCDHHVLPPALATRT